MRVLTWHIAGSFEPGTGLRETYRLDRDYIPVRAWVHLKTAPTGSSPLVVDINVNGTSIFAVRPSLQTDTDWEEAAFASVGFGKDDLVTMDVDQVGSKESGRDMTVGLELEEA